MKTRAILLLLALSLASNASAVGWVTSDRPIYNGTGNWMLPAPPVTGYAPIYYGIGNRAHLEIRRYHADQKRQARAARTRRRLWLREQTGG
jgi:hypothetical protein